MLLCDCFLGKVQGSALDHGWVWRASWLPRRFQTSSERRGELTLEVFESSMANLFTTSAGRAASGAVVVEPDGRVWLVAPTNAYGGYKATFPKGTSNGRDLRATAIKEVFEESGLQVELSAFLVDVSRSLSRTRYYLAHRTGGSPAVMGWESQAVHLAPLSRLKELLNSPNDMPILDALKKALAASSCA